MKGYIKDGMLPSCMDVVVWGHEHECQVRMQGPFRSLPSSNTLTCEPVRVKTCLSQLPPPREPPTITCAVTRGIARGIARAIPPLPADAMLVSLATQIGGGMNALNESVENTFVVLQPGSTVATALVEGEAKAKHVALLQVGSRWDRGRCLSVIRVRADISPTACRSEERISRWMRCRSAR